jgi:hypothetical protein
LFYHEPIVFRILLGRTRTNPTEKAIPFQLYGLDKVDFDGMKELIHEKRGHLKLYSRSVDEKQVIGIPYIWQKWYLLRKTSILDRMVKDGTGSLDPSINDPRLIKFQNKAKWYKKGIWNNS